MPTLKTLAIVLRHADYRENDRMLTLLSPVFGRVDALCRGCRKPKSPLLAASEWFAEGEYVLYSSAGRATVTSCLLSESFYPLRQDYDLLKYATYILAVTEIVSRPGEEALGLFTLLARSLSRLAYKKMEPRAVTAAFLLLLAALEGYRPRLKHCVHCGESTSLDGSARMDIDNGGLICHKCLSGRLDPGFPVRPREILWMRDVLEKGIEKTACPPEDAPLPLLAEYVERRLEKRPASSQYMRL